uniref:TAFA chemokine like family member 5 n=1 Tax=Accipiter nisus TaxID=211598 RepID=A0A8B9N3S5_9AVES
QNGVILTERGQLAAGTCEIVTLDRDSSQPRRTIARQTARCACKKGQIAGTTRARPACVDGKKQRSIQSVSANARVV